MADRVLFPSETELEQALTDLGRHLAYPPTPDLAGSVRRHLAAGRQPRQSFWRSVLALQRRPRAFWETWLPLQRRVALALVALLVIAGAVLAISPEARTAVADRLGLRGVQIGQVPALPATATPTVPTLTPAAAGAVPAVSPATTPLPSASPSPPSPGVRLGLGQQLTLEQARARVAFRLLVPSALGAPDETYLLSTPVGGQVALVYYPRPDVPEASTTGVGVLLTEFQADIHTVGPVGKGLPPGTRLEEVQVNRGRGYWIDGDPHVFFFRDTRGQQLSENTRLASNVLLWEQGPLTLRLESSLPKDAALSIAASVQ
jgi:hypothetical protein